MSTHHAGKWSATNKFPPTPITSGFQPGEPFTLVRPVIGSLAAADAGPFNGSSFPPFTFGFGCDRYETVFVSATWTGSGTLQITPMFYDVEAQVWVDMLISGAAQVSDTFDGTGTTMSEVRVFGRHCVFFKVAVLGGGPLTNVEIFAMPGRGRENAFFG